MYTEQQISELCYIYQKSSIKSSYHQQIQNNAQKSPVNIMFKQ